MFTIFVRGWKSPRLAFAEIIALVTAFMIAELFYKFHSFTLECLAFLGTWFVLGAFASFLASFMTPRAGASAS